MAVQAVGILIRYTLGSENRFYNKVFYEYFKVMLKNYENFFGNFYTLRFVFQQSADKSFER